MEERKLQDGMYACVILHNMIIEYKWKLICAYKEYETFPETQPIEINGDEHMDRRVEICNTKTPHNYHIDLVEHIQRIQNINLDPIEIKQEKENKRQ